MFTWGFLEWDSQCIDFHRWSFVRKLRLDVQEQSEDDKLCMGKVGYYWWWIEAYPPSWAAAEVARRASVSFCSAFFSSSNFWWELCNAVISARSSMATSSVEPSFSNRILASSFSLFVTSWKKIEHVYLTPIFRNFIRPSDLYVQTCLFIKTPQFSVASSIKEEIRIEIKKNFGKTLLGLVLVQGSRQNSFLRIHYLDLRPFLGLYRLVICVT